MIKFLMSLRTCALNHDQHRGFAILFLLGDVSGQLTMPPPTCPGDIFSFTCNVEGINAITIWRVDGSSNMCTLSHLSTSPATCRPRNDFIATPGTGFGTTCATSYTSTLSGTASPTLNGILVECFGPVNSVDTENRVGYSSIHVLGQ